MTYLSYVANRKRVLVFIQNINLQGSFLLCKGAIIFISVTIIEAEVQGL